MATADLTTLGLTEEQIARFWGYVNKDGPDGCWLWTRGKTRAGYGVFHPRHNVNVLTHRLAWMLTNGDIPAGMCICHDCPAGDDPACCNPAHVFLGTHKDNMRDGYAKGRFKARDADPVCKGSRHGVSKLNEELVRQIRASYDAGLMNQYELAREHGVTQATVWGVVNRKTWRHVE